MALLRMDLARCTNWSVDSVSAAHTKEGLTQATMVVRALPPRESCGHDYYYYIMT